MNPVIESLRSGLIVSCQAMPHEPLHGSHIMQRMALAAEEGGAVGIRANTPDDIRAIKDSVSLPIIGLYKKRYPESDVYITPTMAEVEAVVEAGADMVAIDATLRKRPDDQSLKDVVSMIKHQYPDHFLVADVSTFEEGKYVDDLNVDLISTTLSGYTEETRDIDGFNHHLLKKLTEICHKPVLAEGRIYTPELAKDCIIYGAYAVVVGSAITRPQEITERFVDEMTL
ncbi:N-acetylmannosamine-6-phosphate 2-epimerase [Tenuibacillus multivorans]|uniref:Putative N-acetylmannosamine-6-phosphate 2-epimerase n=1 Tax=Tenuibacillus multivorans TaxID=237069 RepID=A0A1H0BRQ6_9BACI|nr:N-acetylmannosamine-6-phosphate 2-epimerase [Tenuibacillus multivorans]GEL77060.1 putative N-acetylmannosamine-6-phosphate 2-epimerase [Tenuibacillus multivorans]SDN48312.1 N-acylglucosamine-6-phosphate 2-epimerase [Tenuibacillus multivorans]